MATIENAGEPPLVGTVNSTSSISSEPRLHRSEMVTDLLLGVFWVGISDWLLYHSGTFPAWAAFLALGAVAMVIVNANLGAKRLTLALLVLLACCSARLAWCGSGLAVASGLGLLCCLSMTLNGIPPYLTDVFQLAYSVTFGAVSRMVRYQLGTARSEAAASESPLRWLLPIGLVLLFSIIFARANPDLWRSIATQFADIGHRVGNWLSELDALQVLLWFGSAWLGVGLARPAAAYYFRSRDDKALDESVPRVGYKAIRNSLVSVIALFAVYLIFEFATLWFQELPKGFYYAGYAHEGAAWLTAALALATLLLSLFFRSSGHADPRFRRLRTLAWIWSVENFLLAVAVYHRLAIYVDFNGMTRMRVVGIFGITCVVVGFAWVIVKILNQRDFLWLLRYQLWTVAFAIVLYALLPIDYFVHYYNARQILVGNLPPSVQIPTHETTAEGVLPLIVPNDLRILAVNAQCIQGRTAKSAFIPEMQNATSCDRRKPSHFID